MSRRIYSLLQFSIKIFKIANSIENIEITPIENSNTQNDESFTKKNAVKSFKVDYISKKTGFKNLKDEPNFVSKNRCSTVESVLYRN